MSLCCDGDRVDVDGLGVKAVFGQKRDAVLHVGLGDDGGEELGTVGLTEHGEIDEYVLHGRGGSAIPVRRAGSG